MQHNPLTNHPKPKDVKKEKKTAYILGLFGALTSLGLLTHTQTSDSPEKVHILLSALLLSSASLSLTLFQALKSPRNSKTLGTSAIFLSALSSISSICLSPQLYLYHRISPHSPKTNLTQKATKTQDNPNALNPILSERTTYRNEIRKLFEKKDFQTLETIVEELRKNHSMLESIPQLKIAEFYQALSFHDTPTHQEVLKTLEILEEWGKTQPKSPTPRIAYSLQLTKLAQSELSNRRPLPKKKEKEVAEHFRQARTSLLTAKKVAPPDVYWYTVSLALARTQKAPAEIQDQIAQEGSQKYPEAYIIPQARSLGHSEQNQGQNGDWENYATRLSYGSPLKNEIYTWIVIAQEPNYKNIFTESHAKWEKTKNGFESLFKKYPQYPLLRKYAAHFALLAGDNTYTQKQMEILEQNQTPHP
jgi:hypothetical protein